MGYINRAGRIKICLSLLLLPCFAVYGYAQSSFQAVVTKIIDGDSIVVKRGEKYIEVRLYGIDSPEWKQHSSRMSKKYIKKLIYKKNVIVMSQYHDSYGRLVALIQHDGQDVNGELVRAGAAWVYPRYCKKTVCSHWSSSQIKAEIEGKGLWAEKDPLSPWQWKRLHHR